MTDSYILKKRNEPVLVAESDLIRWGQRSDTAFEIATALGFRQSKPALEFTRAVREREAACALREGAEHRA